MLSILGPHTHGQPLTCRILLVVTVNYNESFTMIAHHPLFLIQTNHPNRFHDQPWIPWPCDARSLGDLASLEQLFLWKNRLSGPIPKELGQLKHHGAVDGFRWVVEDETNSSGATICREPSPTDLR